MPGVWSLITSFAGWDVTNHPLCQVCGLAVLGKENIMRHAAEQHEGRGAYQCQFCKKVRANNSSIKQLRPPVNMPIFALHIDDYSQQNALFNQKVYLHHTQSHSTRHLMSLYTLLNPTLHALIFHQEACNIATM